jgi:hypothetical protein
MGIIIHQGETLSTINSGEVSSQQSHNQLPMDGARVALLVRL